MAPRLDRRKPVLRVIFEGDAELRRGFSALLKKYLPEGTSYKTVAGAGTAIDRFVYLRKEHPDDIVLLLLDQGDEGAGKRTTSHEFNGRRFWMSQVMESWFLSDHDSLAEYYGQGFSHRSLPAPPRGGNEAIAKDRVLEGLKRATEKCGRGPYHKTLHAPDLLQFLDPHVMRQSYPEFAKFLDAVHKLSH